MSHRIQSYVRNLQPPKKVPSPRRGAPAVLGSTIKLVLYCLCSRADYNTLECHPSKERIAKDASASIATVKRSLEILEDAGLIRSWHRKKDDGSWGEKHYKLVLTDNLPDGWGTTSEKTSENLSGFSENPRKETKRSEPPPGAGEAGLGDRGEVLRAQNPSLREPLTTTEPPYEPPHTQQPSAENPVCEKCYQVASLIRKRWPKEALKGPGLDTLPEKAALASQKTGRSPDKLVIAVDQYLRAAKSSPRGFTWLGYFFDREEYLQHMPPLTDDEKRRADDATYAGALREFLAGRQWPGELGPPPGKPRFWAPWTAIGPVIFAAADSRWLRTLVAALQKKDVHPEMHDVLWRMEEEFRALRAQNEWRGAGVDPRAESAGYPAYLYERHGIARQRKPDLRVVA